MAEATDKDQPKQAKGQRPVLTPEQEAEAAQKKAARAQAKAGKGAQAAAARELATERPRRTQPPRVKHIYDTEIRPRLMAELGLKNPMQAPKLVKVTLNMGLGEAMTNPKILDAAAEHLALVTGQRPVVTRARKSIANFKLKTGQRIGAMVTLRKDTMYEFLDRLVTFALPRVRDFKGISPNAFDGRGNYTLGVREAIIFTDANAEKLEQPKGLNVTITTTARTDEEGRALLRHLGMPFRS